MPARKKKKPSAKDKADAIKAARKGSFEKNELVFAFVSGHPRWPAVVERFNEESFDYSSAPLNVRVGKLFPFEGNRRKCGVPSRKITPKKTKLFEKSVEDCVKFKAGENEDYLHRLLSELNESRTSDSSQNESAEDCETDSGFLRSLVIFCTL